MKKRSEIKIKSALSLLLALLLLAGALSGCGKKDEPLRNPEDFGAAELQEYIDLVQGRFGEAELSLQMADENRSGARYNFMVKKGMGSETLNSAVSLSVQYDSSEPLVLSCFSEDARGFFDICAGALMKLYCPSLKSMDEAVSSAKNSMATAVSSEPEDEDEGREFLFLMNLDGLSFEFVRELSSGDISSYRLRVLNP